MQIQLVSLHLINFKGIKDRKINFAHETFIYGDNATGKTTLFDAFTWLFFGKDSSDRKDFEIKTLDSTGNPKHKLEHSVEAVIDIDGTHAEIKRIYKEKWTKRRGAEEAELTGHETLFYWNEVPLQAKEYEAKVSGVLKEDLFKLLTNPLYFNSIKWQDRRNILLSIAGDITNDQVADVLSRDRRNLRIGPLMDVLNSGKSLEEYKRTLAAKKKKLQDDLKAIPTRIDEVVRQTPEAPDFAAIDADITSKQKEIDHVDRQIESATAALNAQHEAAMAKQQQINDLKKKCSQREYDTRNAFSDEKMKRVTAIAELNRNIESENDKVTHLWKLVDTANKQVEERESHAARLRERWHEKNKSVLAFKDDEFCCPTCKRAYDTEDIDQRKEEMQRNFNEHKTAELASISTEGKSVAGEIETLKAKIATLNADIDTAQQALKSLKEEVNHAVSENECQNTYSEAKVQEKLFADREYQGWNKSIIELEGELEKQSTTAPGNEDLKQQRQQLVSDIVNLNKQLGLRDQIEKAEARKSELETDERKLAQQLADLEQSEFAIEVFNKTKMDMLEHRINEMFTTVQFRMFESQINGGEAECCETLVNGVPFADANNAAKINAGLEIIQVLGNYYEVSAPIFIDNRESINQLSFTSSQVINLVVSQDSALRVA